ncbi:cellulase family glycosylhydrolase [Methylobacterium sp. J-059]|uniref:cellulase family glycosylhydrolase n=1 Tax=Methylobacterium sp. J-059 TaxID=2836643 RepID=UPI001FBB1798|nr:cellulase family glycosylhydrolase [Methylobacterium sp. J-059]MCJ2041940.1 cellulase family glycosylhydrolase [Methylobacterium sp. J-059]
MYRVTESAQLWIGDATPAPARDVPPRAARPARTPRAPDLAEVSGWLLRRWAWLLVATLLGGLAGYLFTRSVTPRFTATTDLVVAPSNLRVVTNDLYAQNLQSDAQILDVESKMRVVTSSNVLRRVADRLALANAPEFNRKPALIDVGAMLGLDPEAGSGPSDRSVAAALGERIKVVRQERSYVVTVSVWASTADLSAKLADAIAEAFRDEIARGDAERVGLAAESLSDRLGLLKAKVEEADRKVEAFRSAHGLLQVAGGELTSTQAMDRMSVKVTDAHARLAEAEARYRAVSRALDKSGSQAGAVQSSALTGLLGEDAALRRQVASLSQTFGPRHPRLPPRHRRLARARLGGGRSERIVRRAALRGAALSVRRGADGGDPAGGLRLRASRRRYRPVPGPHGRATRQTGRPSPRHRRCAARRGSGRRRRSASEPDAPGLSPGRAHRRRRHAAVQGLLALLTRLSARLGSLAAARAPGPPRLALELLNEPEVSPAAWQPMLEAAYRAARAGAARLPLVLGGGSMNAATALEAIDPRPFDGDGALLYTFHDYEPWQFTHQGLRGNPAYVLDAVPYPAPAAPEAMLRATEARIAGLALDETGREQARAAPHNLADYARSGFDAAALETTFARVTAWRAARGLPVHAVLLGEFGVSLTPYGRTRDGAAARARWLHDMRTCAERHGFAWACWSYVGPGGFALAENEAGPGFDAATLRALGLVR